MVQIEFNIASFLLNSYVHPRIRPAFYWFDWIVRYVHAADSLYVEYEYALLPGHIRHDIIDERIHCIFQEYSHITSKKPEMKI